MMNGKMPTEYIARTVSFNLEGGVYMVLKIEGRRFQRIKDILIELVFRTQPISPKFSIDMINLLAN